jgi:rhodanese-related sulfurtransferase
MKKTLFVISLAFTVLGCEGPPRQTGSMPSKPTVAEISPASAEPRVSEAYTQFIDVRTPEEFAAGHAPRARNIPLDKLAASLDLLRKNEPVYVICETGRRSKEASDILIQYGFFQVFNIIGGTAAWRDRGLPIRTPTPPKTDLQ